MTRTLGILAAIGWLSISSPARADDKDATPILDKAIAALGGEAKLAWANSSAWKWMGVGSFGKDFPSIRTTTTFEGLDRLRREVEFESKGVLVRALTVFDGSKAWLRFNNEVQAVDDAQLASTRQTAYLAAVAATILPLKTKDFQVEAAADSKVGDKLAAVVKAVGPDGHPFTLFFDKATGLPLKVTSTIRGIQGGYVNQETTYADYKDFDGIKRATKVENTSDGHSFLTMEYLEFKRIEKPNPAIFAKPG